MPTKQPTRKNEIKGQWLKPIQSALALLTSNSVYALGTMKAKDREATLKAEYESAVADFLNDNSDGRLSKCFDLSVGTTSVSPSLKFKDIFPVFSGLKKSLFDRKILVAKTITSGLFF